VVLAGLVIAALLIQRNPKSAYLRAVRQELERLPEGQQIKAMARNHSDKRLRRNLAKTQLQALTRSYKDGMPPAAAAREMVAAVNEMLNAGNQGK